MVNGRAEEVNLMVNEAMSMAGSAICAASYGVALTLYCICAYSLYRQLGKPGCQRGTLLTLIYTTFAIACLTAYHGLSHYQTQMAFVFHRDFPGGPMLYTVTVLSRKWSFGMCLAIITVLDWLTLAIQIWRLWILWTASRYRIAVVAVPSLLFVAFLGVGLLTMIKFRAVLLLDSNTNWLYPVTVTAFGIPPAITIFVTTLIVIRLVIVQRQYMNVLGGSSSSNPYTGVIAILVESYALDATWAVVSIISFAFWRDPHVYLIFIQSEPSMKVISLFMIVYRVTKGRAWRAQTEQQLSGLRLAGHPPRGGTTTELTSGPFLSSPSRSSVV